MNFFKKTNKFIGQEKSFLQELVLKYLELYKDLKEEDKIIIREVLKFHYIKANNENINK